MSVCLAAQWGLDTDKIAVAALLHDLVKPLPKGELRKIIDGNPELVPEEEDLLFPQMWHGMAAARIGREEFGITDPSILDAVAWHTTGRKGLSDIGLALFVADFLEPSRCYDGVEALRSEILPQPLRRAALTVAEAKLDDIRGKGRPNHGRTLRMRDWLAKSLN